VCEEVEEGEEDGEGLLHAEEAVEGPFAVELDDGFGFEDARVGDYVLAGVIAFRGTVPEEEAVEESCRVRCVRVDLGDVRISVLPAQFSRSHTSTHSWNS